MQTYRKDKTVKLTMFRKELLEDIEDYSYKEALKMSADDEPARHQVTDVCQEDNLPRVTRVLDMSFDECVDMLYPYSKVPVADVTEKDDKLQQRERYELMMLVPKDFSHTTVELLTRKVHEYMVCAVMADWMSLFKPDSQANWEAKKAVCETDINTKINNRVGRVRRPLTPF